MFSPFPIAIRWVWIGGHSCLSRMLLAPVLLLYLSNPNADCGGLQC